MPSLRRRLLQCLLAATVLVTAAAQADVYGYVDAEGTPHFSTVRLDERYTLFVKGDQPFDSADFGKTGADVPADTSSDLHSRSPLFRQLLQHPNLKKYEALLEQAAHDFSIEPALLKAIMAAESGFNPSAVSPKGAVGLMQLMPATAERYGLAADRKQSISEKLTDPRTNIRLGARYLRDLRILFPGKPNLVIASYNAGEGAVQKYRNTIPPYPETRNYVQLVTRFYQVYRPAVSAPDGTSIVTGRRIQMIIPGRGNMPGKLSGTAPLSLE